MKVEMPLTWVVVADASRARVLHFKGHVSGLEEIEDFVNPRGRLKARDLNSDKHGSRRKRQAESNPEMGVSEDITDQVDDDFARDLARQLESRCRDQGVEALILAAPPKFLGMLRRHLDAGTGKLIRQTINKDISTLSADQIKAHLDRAS